jgi:hypothetical protein
MVRGKSHLFALSLGLFCLWQSPARSAESCSPVRLDAPGESMECVGPMTQKADEGDDTESCYAFAQSEIYDAWRIGPGQNCAGQKRTSPLAAAVDFASSRGRLGVPDPAEIGKRSANGALAGKLDEPIGVFKHGLSAGDGSVVLKSLLEDGGCDHEALFGKGALLEGIDLGAAEATSVLGIARIYDSFRKRVQADLISLDSRSTPTGFDGTPYPKRKSVLVDPDGAEYFDSEADYALSSNAHRIAQEAVCLLRDPGRPLTPSQESDFSTARAIVADSLLSFEDPIPFMKKLVDRLCMKHRLPLPTPKPAQGHLENGNPAQQAALSRFIDERFDQPHPQPVSALMCARVLRDSLGTVVRNPAKNACEHGTSHYLTVIGRRRGPGGPCQLLVQNTESCADLGPKSPWPCENGKVWVDQKAFMDNTLELDFLKR